MKVEVQIDSHFQEEAVMITAPALSARVEKIRDFVEELDQKGRLRAKKGWGSLPDRKPAIPTFLH